MSAFADGAGEGWEGGCCSAGSIHHKSSRDIASGDARLKARDPPSGFG